MSKDTKKEAELMTAEAEAKAAAGRIIEEIDATIKRVKGGGVRALKEQLNSARNLHNNPNFKAKQYIGSLESIRNQLQEEVEKQKQEQVLAESKKLKRGTVLGNIANRASVRFGKKDKAGALPEEKMPDSTLQSVNKIEPKSDLEIDEEAERLAAELFGSEESEVEAGNEGLEEKVETHEELQAKGEEFPSEEGVDEIEGKAEEAEENETVEELKTKLAANQKMRSEFEAGMKGETAENRGEVEGKEVEAEENETVEELKTKLAANQKMRSEFEAGMKGETAENEAKEKEEYGTEEVDSEDVENYVLPVEDIDDVMANQAKPQSESVTTVSKDDKGKVEIEPESEEKDVRVETLRAQISEFEKRARNPELSDFKESVNRVLGSMNNKDYPVGYFDNYLNKIESALEKGNVQDSENHYQGAMNLLSRISETKNVSQKGQLMRLLGEELKEIPTRMTQVKQSALSQSFENIIAKAENIVVEGVRVRDQIASLRGAIDVITAQPEFKQYKEEHRAEIIQAKLDAIEKISMVENISKPAVYSQADSKFDPDQKAAYAAISKLDKLLHKVETSKVGMIKSILKGQVRRHLETMNASPLKESIQKVAEKAAAKTETANETQTFKK